MITGPRRRAETSPIWHAVFGNESTVCDPMSDLNWRLVEGHGKVTCVMCEKIIARILKEYREE